MTDTFSPLIELLKSYDNEYYNSGEPMVSDTEYDLFKESVREKYPNHSYFKNVGVAIKDGDKVKLPYVLGSLDKVKSDTVEKWIEKQKGEIIASYKLDGASFMVTWEDGKVVFASTRGDGSEGQNITQKAKYFVPSIDKKGTVSLRGECLLVGDSHIVLGFKNRRNGVVGLLNREDVPVENLKHITPVFYEVLDCESIPETERGRMEYIASLNLCSADWVAIPAHDSLRTLQTMLAEAKQKPYDVDGIVLTVNHSDREDVLIPKNKIAFKTNTDGVLTVVEKVVWNVGRTGKITPLVYIQPVDIGGVTVRKASGFNYEFVSSNKIGPGAKIMVQRGGDVIPDIVSVVEGADVDYRGMDCPSCGHTVSFSDTGIDIYCTNPDCETSTIKQIAHFFKTLGADYITETTIKNLGVQSIEEMFELDEIDISNIEGFGIKKGEQLVGEIYKVLTISPDKLLAAFGISGIGNTLSKPILEYLNNDFNRLFTHTDFTSIEGVGDVLNMNLVDNINNFRPLYEFLCKKGLTFKVAEKVGGNMEGMVFTLTGKMPMKRDSVVRMISAKGGIVKGISKATNYLVTDDPDSGSIKNQKAQSYGTKIISFDELLEMLK